MRCPIIFVVCKDPIQFGQQASDRTGRVCLACGRRFWGVHACFYPGGMCLWGALALHPFLPILNRSFRVLRVFHLANPNVCVCVHVCVVLPCILLQLV